MRHRTPAAARLSAPRRSGAAARRPHADVRLRTPPRCRRSSTRIRRAASAAPRACRITAARSPGRRATRWRAPSRMPCRAARARCCSTRAPRSKPRPAPRRCSRASCSRDPGVDRRAGRGVHRAGARLFLPPLAVVASRVGVDAAGMPDCDPRTAAILSASRKPECVRSWMHHSRALRLRHRAVLRRSQRVVRTPSVL